MGGNIKGEILERQNFLFVYSSITRNASTLIPKCTMEEEAGSV